MKVYFKKIFIIFLLSFIFFLALDAIFGKYVYKKFIKEDLVDVDVIKLSAKDEVYDHTFSKNFKGIVGWGNKRYEFCSDNNGFRISCSKKNKNQKKYDIGFLGDSFTEPDLAFPYLVKTYLPIGLKGIVLCGLFASLMLLFWYVLQIFLDRD